MTADYRGIHLLPRQALDDNDDDDDDDDDCYYSSLVY
jgi:hypothetical protein